MNSKLPDNYILEIKPDTGFFSFNHKEVWQYRYLLALLVRRDFITMYKQTILGPLWFVVQPIITTLLFMLVFGGIAKMSTDGMPQALFYMAGIISWNYFSEVLAITSETFVQNAYLFGKVYFPRIVVPISVACSNLITFFVQLLLFLVIFLYYIFFTNVPLEPNATLLLIPVLLLITAGLGLGLGLLITSLTTKYRDFTYLIGFSIQLAMYATPIIYPTSMIEENWIKLLIMANPMSSVIETFRFAFLGVGNLSWLGLGYSFCCMLLLLAVGVTIFSRVERKFMDTV